MKKIDILFNGKAIGVLHLNEIADGDLIKIALPLSDQQYNTVQWILDKPSRPIDWTQGESQDRRELGIMIEHWNVQ